MNSKTAIISVLFIFSLASCKSIGGTAGSNKNLNSGSPQYSEDLSGYRKAYKPETSNDKPAVISEEKEFVEVIQENKSMMINDTLAFLTDSVSSLRLAHNQIQGYSILVHNGTNHEEAVRIKGELLMNFPDEYSELLYQQPFFRVKIGKFYDQLNAYGLLEKVKELFPKAIIVPSSFKIVEED